MGLPAAAVVASVMANGLLVGASLDQSIKQLPARERIGVTAFAAYSQAADLRNGIAFILGLGAAALTLTAFAVNRRDQTPASRQRSEGHRPAQSLRLPLRLAAGLTVGHLLVTAVAAPVNFSQRTHSGDPAALAGVFDLFERLTAVRTGLQAATLAAMVWALVRLVAGARPTPSRLAAHPLAGEPPAHPPIPPPASH